MKSQIHLSLVFLLCITGHRLLAQSQSQAGLNLGRQWLLESYNYSEGTYTPGWSSGLFYHHQFKDHRHGPSSLGLFVSADYMRLNSMGNVISWIHLDPFPVQRLTEIDLMSMRLGFAINLNTSRGQRLQVYLQGGYHLVHELKSRARLAYSDGSIGEAQHVNYFYNSSPWQHNIYAALDLRYRLGDAYFVGITGQFSTLELFREYEGAPLNFGAIITAGRILISEAEQERIKMMRREVGLEF